MKMVLGRHDADGDEFSLGSAMKRNARVPGGCAQRSIALGNRSTRTYPLMKPAQKWVNFQSVGYWKLTHSRKRGCSAQQVNLAAAKQLPWALLPRCPPRASAATIGFALNHGPSATERNLRRSLQWHPPCNHLAEEHASATTHSTAAALCR